MAVAPKNIVLQGKTHPSAPDFYKTDMRTIEQWCNQLKVGGSTVTAGQLAVSAGASGIGGTNQEVIIGGGHAGQSLVWLVTDAEGDTVMNFGSGWIIHATAGTHPVSLPAISAPNFSGVADITISELKIGAMDATYTNAHVWNHTAAISIPSGGFVATAAGDFATFNPTVGSDLSLGSSGITTAAGGVYWAGFWGRVDYTGALFT